MGLDQSFYNKKPKTDKDNYLDIDENTEVLYFRKFHSLHDYIRGIMGSANNAEVVRLQSKDLNKIAKFLIDNANSYWAFDDDEIDDLPPRFFEAVGVLTYYASKNKPLFYVGDW